MKYNTFIFDLDGTLLDTLSDLASAVNYALRQYDMPEHDLDAVRRFVGNGVRRLMERAVPDGQANPLFELDTTCPYEGISQALLALRQRGCRLAVVSNKMMAATRQLVAHFFPEVEVAIGENEAAGIRRKPAPDTVDEALRLLGAKREEAVYVGDSDVDIQTAANAGLPCISVLWGFRDRDFLLAHGATTLISRPEQLLTLHSSLLTPNSSLFTPHS